MYVWLFYLGIYIIDKIIVEISSLTENEFEKWCIANFMLVTLIFYGRVTAKLKELINQLKNK